MHKRTDIVGEIRIRLAEQQNEIAWYARAAFPTRMPPPGQCSWRQQSPHVAGADIVFLERASGGRWDRPELHRLLDQLREGDIVLVWKLDRLSRSLKDLLTIIERIDERQAGFKSLTEAIDTTSPAGRMMMQMVGAFAEFERAMIRERTRAGLKEAQAGGRIGGRRKKLKPHQEKEIAAMVLKEGRSAAQVARLFNVHPATVGRIVARHAASIGTEG